MSIAPAHEGSTIDNQLKSIEEKLRRAQEELLAAPPDGPDHARLAVELKVYQKAHHDAQVEAESQAEYTTPGCKRLLLTPLQVFSNHVEDLMQSLKDVQAKQDSNARMARAEDENQMRKLNIDASYANRALRDAEDALRNEQRKFDLDELLRTHQRVLAERRTAERQRDLAREQLTKVQQETSRLTADAKNLRAQCVKISKEMSRKASEQGGKREQLEKQAAVDRTELQQEYDWASDRVVDAQNRLKDEQRAGRLMTQERYEAHRSMQAALNQAKEDHDRMNDRYGRLNAGLQSAHAKHLAVSEAGRHQLRETNAANADFSHNSAALQSVNTADTANARGLKNSPHFVGQAFGDR